MKLHPDEWEELRAIAKARKGGAPLILGTFLAQLEGMARQYPSTFLELLDMLKKAEQERDEWRQRAEGIAQDRGELQEQVGRLEHMLVSTQERERLLRQALSPFARFGRAYLEKVEAEEGATRDDAVFYRLNDVVLVLGDLRRARDASKTKAAYDPTYGDDKTCQCSHLYRRHFDPTEGWEAVGCKYCECRVFCAAVEQGE